MSISPYFSYENEIKITEFINKLNIEKLKQIQKLIDDRTAQIYNTDPNFEKIKRLFNPRKNI